MSNTPLYNAATGAMCFASALLSLKQGGIVRRQSWPALCWIALDQRPRFPQLMMRAPSGEYVGWSRPTDDLLAEDWEEALVPFGVTG